MRYDDAIRILFRLESFGVKLGLDNIRLFLDRLGHPQYAFKSIHVAGTNGKGTVCSTLAAVLTAAGYKTGLFTSPHLVDYTERIRIDGRRIPKSEVSRFIGRHHRFVRKNRITFFETTTAMAFAWFARENCDFAVVEVGLGGRLDATNVLDPALTVITAIDLDHTKTLGSTKRRIAGEKAGIIKSGVPVVCAPMADSVHAAIARIAAQRRAPTVNAQQNVVLQQSPRGNEIRVAANGRFPARIRWPYPGAAHRDNLGTTIAALMQLRHDGHHMADRDIKRGLGAARWPGRFQIQAGNPIVIYDVAHNAAAAEALAEALGSVMIKQSVTAVCAVARDKDWRRMIRSLAPHIDKWYFTRFPNRRSWLLADVRAFARQQRLPFAAGRFPEKMLRLAKKEIPREGVILVVGSHFLVGRLIPRSSIDPAPLGLPQ
jgi:dihydrofolate synthase/folylpolyglutamate synthase